MFFEIITWFSCRHIGLEEKREETFADKNHISMTLFISLCHSYGGFSGSILVPWAKDLQTRQLLQHVSTYFIPRINYIYKFLK